jgi:hypothetical protein
VQAWLVDALKATGFRGQLDAVFARGEIVEGAAMLVGSVVGGYLAHNLGVPYVVRAAVLVLTCGVAIQPVLGRVADAWGYPSSYLCSAAFQALAVPFLFVARRQRAESDPLAADTPSAGARRA